MILQMVSGHESVCPGIDSAHINIGNNLTELLEMPKGLQNASHDF